MVQNRTHRPLWDLKKCNHCDFCRLLCPELAITRDPEEDVLSIDLKYCKGCGICEAFCPRDALKMAPESSENGEK